MSNYTRWSFGQQIEWFRRQFAQHAGLPFSEVLPAQVVMAALQSLGVQFYNSLYNPITVLWLFLSQVIHANPTLAATVECFLAWRLARGMSPCAADTGAYARARQRLPEVLLALLTRHTGREAERAAPGEWRWLDRVVKLFDGSTLSMPDTPENQDAFPQSRTQAPGIGFPLVRIGVLFSLAVGTVLELGIRRWAGKFQSELAMLRDMIPSLQAGEVVLTDRYLCSYMEIALLLRQGADYVGRMHAQRNVDFRHGKRLGPCDHVVQWSRPPRPDWMSPEDYAAMPEPSRSASFASGSPAGAIARERSSSPPRCSTRSSSRRPKSPSCIRLRWEAEINLRSLKIVMNMDVLRCQTPDMVRKEIWAHLLAYNLIRTVIAQAAARHGKHPRQISFARAMRTLEAFRPAIARVPREQLVRLYAHMLTAIASHEIGNRPDRLEPRVRKRRPKPYKLMTKPRNDARKQEARTR